MLLRGRLRKAKSSPELRADAKKLRSRLADLLPYSVDAENRVMEEDRARQWLAKLRQELYMADQFIEEYGDNAEAERLFVSVPIVPRFLKEKNIKEEMRNLLGSIDLIYTNRLSMLEESKENGREHKRRDNLVGTEIELEMSPLVDKLTEDHDPSQHIVIFAVVGLGGVGKTTIARQIFDDQRTISAFSTRLWIPISTGSTATRLLLATICAAAGVQLEGSETRSELQKRLADKIVGRRILLVFNIFTVSLSKEGIGNAEIYGNMVESLRLLRPAAEGSRVLITTGDENAVKEIKSAQIQKAAEPYSVQTERPRLLAVEDGWRLLLKAAGLEPATITPDLKKIGIGIVQKCNGLPLAIKAVGGVLAGKRCVPKVWQDVLESGAFSMKDPTTGTEGGVRSSIYLSYQDALPHLKQCFIYLSLFPVDFAIEQHTITQLWISEGLVDTTDEQNIVGKEELSDRQVRAEIAQEQDRTSDAHNVAPSEVVMDENNITSPGQARENSNRPSQDIVEDHHSQPPNETPCLHSSQYMLDKQNNCSVQDAADRYFQELVERGFLQQDFGTKGYKMHDQVRKIAESLAENEAFSGDPKDMARLSDTLHRLCFVNKGLNTIPEDIREKRSLRTLLLSGNPLGQKGLDIIFKNLKLLRVLDLSDTEINTIPKTLGNLVHLRHLNLSRTKIRSIPESIGSLRRLRFLGLQKCEYLTFLPKNIQKLPTLEYLDLRDSKITAPPRLQNLRCLTLLHGFVVDSISGWPLEELQNLSKLSSLQIKIGKTPHRTVTRVEVLKEKDSLRNLELSCCTVNSEPSSAEQERLEKLFTQLHPHRCLVSLKIDGYYGLAFPEWLSFSEFPNLQQLYLLNCKFCKSLPPLCHLQRLKFLRIANLTELHTIDRQQETPSFPYLEELHIVDMQKLEYCSAFEGGDLPCLRKFSLKSCPKLKQLPGGLENCKMGTMEVRKAGLIQSIENLLVQELVVEAMPSLATVSHLPMMEVFSITSCPVLGNVSGVDSLLHIHLEDEQLGHLPKWIEQHASKIETLDILGNEELLARCERNKEDWYIIREIARVHAYSRGRVASFSYTRSNDFFWKYQRQRSKGHDGTSAPTATATVADERGAGAPTSSEANNDSASGTAEIRGTDRKYLEGKFIWALIAGLLCTFCFTFNLDPSEALYLSILFFIAVCALFKFF